MKPLSCWRVLYSGWLPALPHHRQQTKPGKQPTDETPRISTLSPFSCLMSGHLSTDHSADSAGDPHRLVWRTHVCSSVGEFSLVVQRYLCISPPVSYHSWCLMQGLWMYSLLACLEKPLLPEAHSSIRQLARRCAQLRSTLVSLVTLRLLASAPFPAYHCAVGAGWFLDIHGLL